MVSPSRPWRDTWGPRGPLSRGQLAGLREFEVLILESEAPGFRAPAVLTGAGHQSLGGEL